MPNTNVTPIRPSILATKAKLETFHPGISENGIIGFEGLAPRELVEQFRALISHHNATVKNGRHA